MKMLSEHIKLNKVYILKSKTKKDSISLPRRRSRRCVDIQIVSKVQEDRWRETLHEDISILERGRNVENTNIPEGDALTDKVEINLDMLRPLMLNRVGGKIYCTDIVAVHHSSEAKRLV